MPRVSRQQADLNRETIAESASHLFREHGLKGVSVAELMSAAGLTHGGFYGHFESKDALAAEACTRAFEHIETVWRRVMSAHPEKSAAHKVMIDQYLSPDCRDKRGDACPAVAFSADMVREDSESVIRQAYIRGLHQLIETLSSTLELNGQPDAEQDRRQTALVEISLLVGAMTLARATTGTPLSDELLVATRRYFDVAQSAPSP
ncbi:MAG: TetR family transcriptional regulator [Pseudomonas sp.]|nr:TetR family transcriptional regulator [Pseudomonas sp.]